MRVGMEEMVRVQRAKSEMQELRYQSKVVWSDAFGGRGDLIC